MEMSYSLKFGILIALFRFTFLYLDESEEIFKEIRNSINYGDARSRIFTICKR